MQRLDSAHIMSNIATLTVLGLPEGLACNFKRMVHARLGEMENTAQRAA